LHFDREQIRKAIEQTIVESVKASIAEALAKRGQEIVPVELAAREWAKAYCEFAGAKPEEIERVLKEGGLLEVCAPKVAEAYAIYL